LQVNNSWSSGSTVIVVPALFDLSGVTQQNAHPVGNVHIGTGNPGDPNLPPPPPPPVDHGHAHAPSPVIPPATLSANAPDPRTAAPSGNRIALASAPAGGAPPATPLSNLGYTLLPPAPDRSGQDPGAFRGELAVGAGEWSDDETPDAPGDGTASYAADAPARATPSAPALTGAAPSPVPAAPVRADDASAVIASAVEVKAERIIAGEEGGELTPVGLADNAATASEVQVLATAETPVLAVGVTRWWKVAAVLGAGALVQAWYWRRVYKARQRWS
jgi:hypothetical protein